MPRQRLFGPTSPTMPATMLGLTLLVASIALADSVNPTTIVPAIYLATTDRARVGLTSYIAGVFAVYFLGGIILTLGPGQLILSAIPHPGREAKHVIELIAGVLAAAFALGVWLGRERVQGRLPTVRRSAPRPAFMLGAGIMAVELPTAFPYFAAIAAIVGSGADVPEEVLLLVVFNVLFILPLLAVVAIRGIAGERGKRILRRAGDWLQQRSAAVLAALLAAVAVVCLVLGAVGLARGHHHHRRVARATIDACAGACSSPRSPR